MNEALEWCSRAAAGAAAVLFFVCAAAIGLLLTEHKESRRDHR